jgi:hypothetical protein
MTTHKRLVRWTFAEFRHWSEGIRDGRQIARRFHKLVRSPPIDLIRRRAMPQQLRTAVLNGTN